ncbi:hypothetical protein VaNZ11_016235 [Volvox africanus]|uniref:Protein kinase domain-containing protein n=1 Tax=Volvox africanus TaxID=51714 RepID=A0ABQ5SPU0_9CHLO|nr:hypothetical protein VaNZ11_016235 [Volvox africanus]
MGVFDVKLESPIEDLLVCSDADVGELLELDEVVGKGGFATVWRAAFNGQLCACKVLQPRGGTLPPSPIVRLFIRECMSLMLIEHSAIIRCAGLIRMRMVDFPELGLTYDTYGMLLEFCEGGTLKDLLLAQLVYKQDQYALREALSWLAQVASALQQFHNLEMPIIHRDIKPENILLQVGTPSALPGFWKPSQQQQQAGMPPMRLGCGAGGRSFRPHQNLDAKLADLGLGVRVCEKRSVLIRRRAEPFDDSSATAVADASAGAGDDVALQVMISGVASAAAAAAGCDNVQERVRTPFMGFTTTPVKPPKRLGSNQRKPSNRHSNGAGVDSAGAAAAAAGGVGGSPSGVGGGCAEAPGSPPRADTLHRAILLSNVRARLSGTRESAAAWGASGEQQVLVAAAAAAAGGGGGCSLAGQHHLGEARLSPAAVAGAPVRSSGGGSASAGTMEAGGVGGVVGGGNAPAATAAAAASGYDVDIIGGTRSSADGPSPFRDYLQRQPSKQVPYCPPVLTNSGRTPAGGSAPADAEVLASRADGGGVGSSPFTLSFSQSLGHTMGQGHLEHVLSPISERSISADDTMNLSSDCRPCSETLKGSGVLPDSNTQTSSGTHALQLQTCSSRPPPSLGRREQTQMLQTIQEPSDETGPLLSSVSSAPATAGAHHHRLQLRSDQQSPKPPPRSPTLNRQQLPAEQSSPSRGSRLATAAAASVRQGLRRAAVAAAAVGGVLSPRPSIAGNVPQVDMQDGDAAGPRLDAGAGSGGGGDQDSESPRPAAKFIPTPLPNTDLAAHLESRNLHQLQQPQQQSNQQPDQQLPNQTPHHQPQPQHHQQRHGPAAAHSAADPIIPPTHTVTTTTSSTMNPNNALPGGAASSPTPPLMVATAGYGSRGSRVNTGISVTAAVTAATAASGMPGVMQLPRGETMTASATASATVTGTVTVTLSRGPSKDRVGLMSLSSLVRPTLRELRHSESLTRAMRRVGSLLRSLKLPSLPKFRRNSQFQWVYGLTGQAGSCMYMAPEVFRGEPYNEKVDVHSFGVMMYELLARDLLLVRYIGGTRAGAELGVRDPHQYAKKVCEGFRPPRHPRIPEAQWQLIQACWHPDPLVRPDMAEVAATLEAVLANLDSQQAALHTKELPSADTAQTAHKQKQQTPRGRRSSDGGDFPPSSPLTQQKQKKKTQEEGRVPGGSDAGAYRSTADPTCHCIIS